MLLKSYTTENDRIDNQKLLFRLDGDAAWNFLCSRYFCQVKNKDSDFEQDRCLRVFSFKHI